MKKLNEDILKSEILRDEDMVPFVYKDSEGYKTVGVGHLVSDFDPEKTTPYGEIVSFNQILKYFNKDIDEAIEDCESVFTDFYELPYDVQHIIANMMFNLGRTRFLKFKNMIAAINNRDWSHAAVEMEDSRWYHQTGDRSKRLVDRMRTVI